jgi:hypothetical protein
VRHRRAHAIPSHWTGKVFVGNRPPSETRKENVSYACVQSELAAQKTAWVSDARSHMLAGSAPRSIPIASHEMKSTAIVVTKIAEPAGCYHALLRRSRKARPGQAEGVARVAVSCRKTDNTSRVKSVASPDRGNVFEGRSRSRRRCSS